jgi:FMN phosphatase YigB (HAD superfamily)
VNLTFLLDLDDTLLVNHIEEFLPHYLDAYAKHVAHQLDPARFIDALLAGTRRMVQNRRPDCTLKEVFEETFFARMDIHPLEFWEMADRFYQDIFPSLKSLTHPKPSAIQFVEQAGQKGYQLAVATNPLFPLTANLQRLAWADLSADRYPFALVTSYEKNHFTKPDPAFYAEILAYLKWPEGAVVMVGDDVETDITGSRRLGVPAFWLNSNGAWPPGKEHAPTEVGEFKELLPWVEHTPFETIKPDFSSHSAQLAIMRSTPAALDSMCRFLPASSWRWQPEDDSWGLTEVLCHLRDVDSEVHLPRIKRVLEENNPFLQSEDTDTWAAKRGYQSQDGVQALQQFTVTRVRILEILEKLDDQEWDRKARHAIFGPTDLKELVGIIAGHDRVHIRQVHDILESISG